MVGVAFICCTFVAKIKCHLDLYLNIYRNKPFHRNKPFQLDHYS